MLNKNNIIVSIDSEPWDDSQIDYPEKSVIYIYIAMTTICTF